MEDITHASAAQCLVTDLDLMEIGPEAMATSSTSREQAEALIASYVRCMDSEIDEGRCGRIAARVSALMVQQQRAIAGSSVSDDPQQSMARIHAIAAIFDEEQLPAYYE